VTQEKCFTPLNRRDLDRLARLVRTSREDFLRLNAGWGLLYAKRFLCSVLAGAAADHYVNGTTGFGEFSVWNFFAQHPEAPYPVQRRSREDYGDSRLGRDPSLPETFTGWAVDVQGRSVEAAPGDDPAAALDRYLRGRATPTARDLASQTLILLEPGPLLGIQAWPTLVSA